MDQIKTYRSVTAFRDEVAGLKKHCRDPEASSFNGKESLDDALDNALKGKLDVVPRAEALMDKLAGESIELPRPHWELSVQGAFPSVPDYLTGLPEAMWNSVEEVTDRAPVRVFASVCVSQGLSSQQLEDRGITILALCQKLSMIRPVELFVYADMGTKTKGQALMPVIKVETAPLDLCAATYALSSAGFLRQLCFTWAYQYGWGGQWAWGKRPGEYGDRLVKALGAAPQDVVIEGGYLHDPLVTQPVEWLNSQINRYLSAEAWKEAA